MKDRITKYLDEVNEKYVDELYFKDFNNKFNRWIENVNDESDKKILCELLMNLKFFSRVEIKSELRKKIFELKSSNDDFKETIFIPLTPAQGRYSGANEIIQHIKEIDREEKIKESELLPYGDSIRTDIVHTIDISNLIIVDDISCTGGTVKKFINANSNLLEGKKVIIMLLVVTDEALEFFDTLKKQYSNIQFEFTFCEKLDKLSSLKLLSSDQYNRLISIEENLWGGKKEFVLGFKRSELLVLFSHNIPNNTVSSFWFTSQHNPNKWVHLFKRITAPKRESVNYRNKKRRNK
ncbi:hypothetical protein [Bacillus haynesii]|uniref:phosphoribosyltransferase-like protein n=1 Tax=Bacillus haynesii TaxID=1925021 RepID=UPI0022813A22|nr:hypothetical protein [Bacillus haynesii]MCY8343499.1 hypothetical protein [Bacillus haynesii]MCY9153265.1 hypothetical protein [Bacillus haynesii]MCY9277424.1 hypothetical protein [Bacillus haynesii]